MKAAYPESLKSLHTFHLDAFCRGIFPFTSPEELIKILQNPEITAKELLILGGGSNILFRRTELDVHVLLNRIPGIRLVSQQKEEVIIEAGAGVVWHELVLDTLEKGWFGLENLSLIPGTCGAAPMQNIGAYGVELKDVFHSLTALNRKTLAIETFDAEACAFGYRESVFKNTLKGQYIILNIQLRLSTEPKVSISYGAIKDTLAAWGISEPSPKDVSKAVVHIRSSKLPDPAEIGNAGSFFKNPEIAKSLYTSLVAEFPEMPSYPIDEHTVKVPAGWLIEHAGWKGFRDGDAGVHAKQALVLVNYGHAEGEQLVALSEKIIASVREKYGIDLHAEVNLYPI
jgi:UDP-N-acetylmuramate dehydrogenase